MNFNLTEQKNDLNITSSINISLPNKIYTGCICFSCIIYTTYRGMKATLYGYLFYVNWFFFKVTAFWKYIRKLRKRALIFEL